MKKVIFNIPIDIIRFLQDRAKKEGLTVTDILYQSINAEKFFAEQEEKWNKVLIERPDGRMFKIGRGK